MPRRSLFPLFPLARRLHPLAVVFLLLSLVPASLAPAGDGSIADPSGEMEFEVNFRFPPTSQQLADTEAALTHMSELLCDATDGEIRVTRIRLTAGAVDEDKAGFWYQPQPGRSGGGFWPDGSGLTRLGNHLNIFPGAHFKSDVLVHEMGHHALGLGEQYDEQRRFGGGCGIGRGFESGAIDERNHSIMQQSGYTQCVGGADATARCLRDSDCTGGTCEGVLMSELSVASNHDQVIGDDVLCPAVQPLSTMDFTGTLDGGAPIDTFDATDFSTATATSSHRRNVEAIDDTGALPANLLRLYFTRTAADTWQVSAGIDDGEVGGTEGDLNLLEQWTLTFAADGSLDTVSETPPQLTVSGLSSGASDLDVDLDFTALTQAATSNVVIDRDGFPLCAAGDCQKRWNTGTERWESSHQSLIHNFDSDWETLVDNYSFVTAPAGLPTQAAPAACLTAPTFVRDVEGSDQALLILDRSWSMTFSSRSDPREVCDNSRDDDGDGTTDEAECAQTRLDFIKAAARAFIDLQRNRGIQLGILEFDDGNRLVRPIEDLNPGNAQDFKDDVDDITPGNNTAIGSALAASEPEFARVLAAGRTRTAILMTDGENNRGVDPQTAADSLRDLGVRVHTIPAGSAADVDLLSDLAGESGGVMIAADEPDELPAVYAEMAARYQGEALVVPRTPFSLVGAPQQVPDGGGPIGVAVLESRAVTSQLPRQRSFPIPVEAGAEELTAFIAGRNRRMSTWDVDFTLSGPGGESFGPSAPEVTVDPWYLFIRVPEPSPGTWQLQVRGAGPGLQESILLASVENSEPDFYVDVLPRTATVAEPVQISADPSYVTHLEGDVSITGRVERPDGNSVPITLTRNPLTGSWGADFSDYAGRGPYQVRLALAVGPDARPAPGEPIFDGPERPDVEVVPFQRFATTTFFLADGPFPPCTSDDCDGDGIPNDEEPGDPDGDGTPSYLDPDSDDDELPDDFEGSPDAYDPLDVPPSLAGSLRGDRLRYSFHVGSTHPLGDLNDVADANIHLRLDASYRLTDRLGIQAFAGLSQMTAETASGRDHPRYIHLNFDARVSFPTATGLRPYLQAGPGIYWPKGGGSDPGFNVGLGAEIPLQVPFSLEFGADYHQVNDEEEGRFITAQLGVSFR